MFHSLNIWLERENKMIYAFLCVLYIHWNRWINKYVWRDRFYSWILFNVPLLSGRWIWPWRPCLCHPHRWHPGGGRHPRSDSASPDPRPGASVGTLTLTLVELNQKDKDCFIPAIESCRRQNILSIFHNIIVLII